MNNIELICTIEEVESSTGDKAKLLTRQLRIDGKAFNEKFAIDMEQLSNSCKFSGEFEILTCSCGIANCAGIYEGILVLHQDDTIIWNVPNPISWPTYQNLPDNITHDKYIFDKKQYVTAIRQSVENAKKLLRDAEERENFVQTGPSGFTTYDFDSLNIRPSGFFSPSVNKALEFSAKAHLAQMRKGTDIPYVTHPFAVGMILANAGCEEEVIISGILHDTVEDTDVALDDIRTLFGEEVAGIVAGCSEPDKDASWEDRKQHTLDELKDAPLAVKFVTCADKLHNVSSMIEEHKRLGDEVWKRFKRGKEDQGWYFRGLLNSLGEGEFRWHPLYREFKRAVEDLFGQSS
jgi:hypothetical protein